MSDNDNKKPEPEKGNKPKLVPKKQPPVYKMVTNSKKSEKKNRRKN